VTGQPPERGVWSTSPAAAWEDAFVAGNGRHGALCHGTPGDERVVVTHHRLLVPGDSARRPPPAMAGRLPRIRELLLAGKSAEALELSCGDWPEWLPQTFHPAFAVRVRARRPPGAGPVTGYRRAADFTTGLLTSSWHGWAGHWQASCFVSRARDVVVQRFCAPPAADLLVSHEVTLPGAPPGLVVRHLDPVPCADGAVLTVTVEYPGGAGGYTGVTRVCAPGGAWLWEGGELRARGAPELVLLTRVARQPATRAAGGLARHLAALPASHQVLLAEHTRLHRPAFTGVRLDLGASPRQRSLPVEELIRQQAAEPGRPLPALLEKLFDSGRYLLLSASGELPPRLTGLWQGDWRAAWAGAIVTNANLGLQLAGAVTTGVPAAVHALARMVCDQLEDWRLNAARLYGARGVLAPTATDGSNGFAGHFSPGYPHHLWTGGADWLLVTLLDHAAATGDDIFLRDRVLPALTELALFYEDFLAGPDGAAGQDAAGQAPGGPGGPAVVFAPSYSPENHPAGWTGAAVNATMDIAAARHALTAAATACARLGVQTGPGEGVARWRALLGRLPDYQLNDDGALAEWAWPPDGPPVGDTYDHRHVSHLYPVWPLREIGPDTTPRLAAAALRALELRGAENGSAHGLLHRALAAARLRDGTLAGQLLTALTGGGYFFGSLVSGHYPGPTVYNCDAACCLPGLLAELLVGSAPPDAGRPGLVELLPAVPDWLPQGTVTGIRTLAGVTTCLAWDLRAGQATATLRSRSSQQVWLACHRAASCEAVIPGAAPVQVAAAAPGTWRIALPATTGVQVRLGGIQ
jgi:alpha-L-fucosidase 2